MTEPPTKAVAAAEAQARLSPCAKSKRGAAMFFVTDEPSYGDDPVFVETLDRLSGGIVPIGAGHNGPPADGICDGSQRCRESCGKRCAHAEHRAIRGLIRSGHTPSSIDIVHVKIGEDGKLVAGGSPSCMQCAVEIADVHLGGVWLYEETATFGFPRWDGRNFVIPDVSSHWCRYTASEFLAATKAHPKNNVY